MTLFLPVEREHFVTGHMHPPFQSEAAARSSSVLAIATVLATGRLDPELIMDYTRPDLIELCDRISVVLEKGHPIRYARVEVDTIDGRCLVAEGHDHAFDPADWLDWLAVGGTDVLGRDVLAKLVAAVDRLEGINDVAELTALLRPRG